MMLFLLLPFLAYAETWTVNRDHSEINFQIPYLQISEVTGKLMIHKGSVELDAKGSVLNSHLEIAAKTISTGIAQRDGHLRSQDFLFVDQYPLIIYQGAKTGTLRLRGQSRKIQINFKLTPSIKDTWGYESRFIQFNTTLHRQDFNIKWNKTLLNNGLLIGDEIKISGHLQIQPVKGVTPTSKHLIPDTPSIRSREKAQRGESVETKAIEVSRPSPTVGVEQNIPSQIEKGPTVVVQDMRERALWQIWFWILGLLGFFAALILGMFGKKLCMDYFKEKYAETGTIGNLSDIFTIGFTLIYAMAFWYVGWG